MVAYVAKATRNSSVDEIGERYRLNHAIVVQAAVCGTKCLQAACLQSTLRNDVTCTLTNTALDLILGVGGSGTTCL